MVSSVGGDTEVGRVRVRTSHVSATRVSHGVTTGSCVIHVTNSCVVVVCVTGRIVLELNFVCDVVEDNLVVTQVLCVVSHISPLNDEHHVRVTNFEGVG